MKYFTVSPSNNSWVEVLNLDSVKQYLNKEYEKRIKRREFYILVQLWEQTHFENTSSHTKGE